MVLNMDVKTENSGVPEVDVRMDKPKEETPSKENSIIKSLAVGVEHSVTL